MVSEPNKSVASQDPVTEISAFLAPELQAVESLLREVIQSDSQLIREVGEYVCLSTGKKLRPIMTLLSARAFGAPPADLPVKIAAALEAIHVATLIHDDVIDKAPLRRGKPSVNARWGDDVAILMADYLFAAAFDLALYQLAPEPLRLLTFVTRKMCESELYSIERRGRWLTSDDYLNIIRGKTAHLFSACCALGAMHAGRDLDGASQASAFGLNFGLAFQITDDALDYVADDAHWGKAVGIDLAAGKQTLPLILTLQSASDEDRRKIEAVMNNGRDFKTIAGLFHRYGSIDRSLEMAREFTAEAVAQLQSVRIVDEFSRDYLLALSDYVISRRF